jgi:protein NRD1
MITHVSEVLTFCSGATNEDDLMAYISRYARVQSCIVNHDKRHAFLKLISHQDAINAKQSIDSRPETEYRNLFERMNWAVGFGPTQFADYKKGESVLPIDVLTDAVSGLFVLRASYKADNTCRTENG